MRIKVTCFVEVPDGYRGCSMESSIQDAFWDSITKTTSSKDWSDNVSMTYEKTEVPSNSTQE